MSEKQALRLDIQALRGLAVSLVVLYHADLLPMPAGYLGVDIFFVISGYLITTMIGEGIHSGSFSFRDFYLRRARRLLPASYATILACAVCAPWILNQQELRDFAAQVAGALTFTGNFVLWQQTNYFGGDGDLKPLLHVWSLSLEEQYYFVLPALLMLVPQRRWRLSCTALLLASLALSILGTQFKPVATFYLLPTRAWELMIGSMGALWQLRGSRPPAWVQAGVPYLHVPALLLLLALPVFPLPGPHPGWNAALVCIATLAVLLRKAEWPQHNPVARGMGKLGDISYSLYLVHWPILAFIHNAWVGSPPIPVAIRALAVLLCLALAALQYRYIEIPFRHRQTGHQVSIWRFAALTVSIQLITPVTILAQSAQPDYAAMRRANVGLSASCAFENRPFTPSKECQTSEAPSLLVWGDSFAMHLVPGLVKELRGEAGLVQATRSACGPLLDLAPQQLTPGATGRFRNRQWAEGCLEFNQSVVEYLERNPAIETVVLSTALMLYLEPDNTLYALRRGERIETSPMSLPVLLQQFALTVARLNAMGKRVVWVAPPPSSDFNIGGCLEKQLSATLAIGAPKDCTIQRSEYLRLRAAQLEVLDAMEKVPGVTVQRMDSLLCNARDCQTLVDDIMIYRDQGHLSYAGSEWMAARLHWQRLATPAKE